jgi:hypothetical protein
MHGVGSLLANHRLYGLRCLRLARHQP